MMKTVSIGEAKPGLCDLVEKARHGRTHIITVRGQACAQIGPVVSEARKLTDDWRKRVKAEKVRLNRPGLPRVTIKELIKRGRK
jgi:antitoxin (DNA-binding transcriptional repressor) of toxin-antitoxin stability system